MFLSLLGAVAFLSGVTTMLFGATSIIGVGTVTPEVDSEMRFFAAWYAAAGVVVLRAVPRVEWETATVRSVAGAFFVAGCARAISLTVVGTPHVVALVLMAVELVLPLVIVPWQANVGNGKRSRIS